MKPAERTTPVIRARNPMWSVPVGLQLSLVYAVILAVTLGLLGWALYVQLEGFLVQNTAERLDRLARPILLRQFPPRGGDRGGPPGGSDSTGNLVDQAADYLVRELGKSSDIAVAVLDAEGKVINSNFTEPDASDGLVKAPGLTAEWADKIKSGSVTQVAQWVVAEPGSARMLVVLTPLTLRANDGSLETPLYLEQATSLEGADAVLNQLRLYIVLGIVAGMAIGVAAGMALTRTILRPLDRMVRTAEAIAGGDLDRRLNLPSGRNEVARLGSAFDHMVERLGAALQAQRRFVVDASHELRTPLTSLEGLSEMLLMGADRGDTRVVQRTVRAMHGELERLGRLVADLLTLSRLDSTAPVKLVPADVCLLLNEVSEQMSPIAESHSVRLVARCGEAVMVRGEPDKLKQVVLNLADNALRYTPPGGEVALSAACDRARGQVEIRVQDTGTGIAPDDLPHIFDRFYRGDLSRARATGNTGLGLAIVRGIVEAHGGLIAVESTPGEGTCFTITLPSLPPSVPPAPAQKARNSQEAALVEESRR
jgi:two-component system OmpR family sensor kinase